METSVTCRTFQNRTLYQIEKNPSKHIGKLYAFQGEVLQAQESNSEIVFQMLTKDYRGSYDYGPSLTVLFNRPNTPIVRKSWVKVLGYIGPAIEGRNAFGASVSSLTVKAIAVTVDGHIYYSTKDEATVEQWRSGELFAPKSSVQSKQTVAQKTKKTDATYAVVGSNIVPGIKRSLDVRLSKKVSEAKLGSIALKLKKQDSRSYKRIFICYYLPDMEVGAGAWATTHFNPNLKVQILGLTSEQEKTLKQVTDDPSRKIIGNWLDETPYAGSRIAIFRQNGKLFLENMFKDGSSGKKEVIEKSSGRKRTFRAKEKNNFGEFYLIDKQGNLQLWDNEGYISTAKKFD